METNKNTQSPTEIIEGIKNTKHERIYIKFAGDKMYDVTSESNNHFVRADITLIPKYIDKLKGKNARYLHSHPADAIPFTNVPLSGSVYPSGGDLTTFLSGDHIRSMVIAETNPSNGKVRRYGIIRKTKKTPERKYLNILESSIMDLANFFTLSQRGMQYYLNNYGLQFKVISNNSSTSF